MTIADELLSKALELPASERAAIAQRLISSLDPAKPDPGAKEAWDAEIKRRLAHADDSKLIDWRESIRRAHEKLSKLDEK
jgi:putative addiction module component (TIGR02574 family)